MARKFRPSLISLATAYADQSDESTTDDDLVIPEDLSALSREDLSALSERAREAFAALYGDGSDLSDEDMAALEALTEGIEALNAEISARAQAAAERAEAAAALAARVNPEEGSAEESEDEGESDENVDEDAEGEVNAEDESESEDEAALVASSSRAVRVNLSGLRSRQAAHRPVPRQDSSGQLTLRDLAMAAPDVPGFANGAPMDYSDMGLAVDSRLTSFNKATYDSARAAGRHIRQQFGVATIRKPIPEDLRITSNDAEHLETVFSRAVDPSRLPGGSLVAAGGWCAPSETWYDITENETRAGLITTPEVGLARGGVNHTLGPDFRTLFSEITGFHYTEEQDLAGEYGVDSDGVGNDSEGNKPCYSVPCPEFTDDRLGLVGLCITAGLLQRRGYPEVIARTIRGALVAHDHRVAGRKIAAMVAGSDAVTMTAGQVGALAPILTSIEMQVDHYRYVHRLGDQAVVEAVFPFWVRGLIRADLSRRLGVDLISVSNARIAEWFRNAGINAQFVYNWQDLTGDAADFTAYPSEISFLMYAAGTWVAGTSDVITLDTVYDSMLLGQNDYTALFTEEGLAMLKRGHDSRVITVEVCPDGSTAAGVAMECDGTEAAAGTEG